MVQYQDGFEKVFVFKSNKPGALSFHIAFPVAWRGSSGNHERIINQMYEGTDYQKYKVVDPGIYSSSSHNLRMPGADKIERDGMAKWGGRPFLLHTVFDVHTGEEDWETADFYRDHDHLVELIDHGCMRVPVHLGVEPTKLVGKASRSQEWERVHRLDAHRRSLGIIGIAPTEGIDLFSREEFEEKHVTELAERVTSGDITCEHGKLELVKYMNRFWTVIKDDSDAKNIIYKRMNITTRDMEVNYTSINNLKSQYGPVVFPVIKRKKIKMDDEEEEMDDGAESEKYTKKNIFDIWKNHPQRMAKRSVEFNPRPKDFVPEKYRPRDCDFNFFDARCILSLKEAEDSYNSIDEEVLEVLDYHMIHVVCDGNYKLYDALTNFMVNKWLRPWDKPPLVFTLKGIQGCGKTLTVKAYGKSVFGKYFKVTSNVQSISGKFNGSFLDQLLFAFLDEAEAGTGTADSGTTKHVISGDTVQTERKGKDAETRPSFLNFMRATNKQHCVEAESSTRRELVLECNPALTEEKHCYFRKLHELIGDFAPDQRRNMGAWLYMQWLRVGKDHGLDKWNCGHGLIVPHKELAVQMRQSGSNIFNWIMDSLLQKGYLVHPNHLSFYVNKKGDEHGKVSTTEYGVTTLENPMVISPFIKTTVQSDGGQIVLEKDMWIPAIAEEDLKNEYQRSPVYANRKRYGKDSAAFNMNSFRSELKLYLGCGDSKKTTVRNWIPVVEEGDVVKRELKIEINPVTGKQKYLQKQVYFFNDYNTCLEHFHKMCPGIPREMADKTVLEDYDENAPFKNTDYKKIPRPPIRGWEDSRPNAESYEWDDEPFRLWDFHRVNNDMTWDEIDQLKGKDEIPSSPPPASPSSPKPSGSRPPPRPARTGSSFFTAYEPDYGTDEDLQSHGNQQSVFGYPSPDPESDEEEEEDSEAEELKQMMDQEAEEEADMLKKRKQMEEESLGDFEPYHSDSEPPRPESPPQVPQKKKRKFVQDDK